MKVLDRYIIRELIAPIFYSAFILVFLILIADLFDNLDSIIKNQTPLWAAARYYLAIIPYSFLQILPWACWIGTLFLLVNFGIHHEMTAMKVAGIPITTIVRPILFVGLLLGIIYFLIGERILYWSYNTATQTKDVYIDKTKGKHERKTMQNVTYYDEDERIYFRNFNPIHGEVKGAVIIWFDPDIENSSRQTMVAEAGVWKDSSWEFTGVTEYSMNIQGKILGEPRHFDSKVYPEINISPDDLVKTSGDSEIMSYKDLEQSIEKLRESGVDTSPEKVNLYSRLATPWQGLVMMLITIPLLAPTATRKGIALKVLFCVGLIFAFYVMGAVTSALGKAGKIPPFLGAWLANILFSGGALLFLDRGNR